MKNWKMQKDSDVVCYCQNINKKTIVDSICRGNHSLLLIKEDTTACTGGNCKINNPSGICCSEDVLQLIKIYSPVEESSNCCPCCSS